MNREQLEYFSVAYRTHNFAAAARLIPMSAQGFAKSIRSLEAELGVALFEKDENGLQIPTAYADRLIDYATETERDYLDLQKSFRQISAAENQEVLLGTSLGIMGFLGSDFLERFNQRHPEIGVTYSEMNDTLCDDGLADGTYGLAFTLAPYRSEFATVEVYSTEVCLWIKADDPLSKKERISIDDLEGRSIAMPGHEFKCYQNIMKRCDEHGVRPASVLVSSEMFWLYNFALEGRGLAFSARHLGDLPFFNDGRVRCIPLDDIEWRIGVSILPKHEVTEAESQFYRYCLSYFSKRFGKVE